MIKSKFIIEKREFTLLINYKNIKNLNIKIKSSSIIQVSCPYGVSYNVIEKSLNKNKNWIIKNTINKDEDLNYNRLIYLGEYYNPKIIISHINKIELIEDNVEIHSKDRDEAYISNLIKNWYYDAANKILISEIEIISERLEIYPSKVCIGNQKTLWGSCNSKKHIRLNWRLVLMPSFVREYIIIHELCHIIHMNHSSDFWLLVNKYCSQYNESKLWIKENGKKIMNIY